MRAVVVALVLSLATPALGEKADRKRMDELAKLIGRALGVPAAAAGDDWRTLGLELPECDDAALLKVLRVVGAERLRKGGFTRIFCYDAADQMAQRDL